MIKENQNYPTSGDETPMNNCRIRFALQVKPI